jgi:cellulase
MSLYLSQIRTINLLTNSLADQLSVTGGGSASPALIQFPGAYQASDPGILIDIYASMATYVAPGPTVYSGGSTKSAGSGCSGVETGTTTGPAVTITAASSSSVAGGSSSTMAATTSAASGSTSGCSVAKYGQCGGNSYTGCTVCASGSTCTGVSVPYYYQCV